MIHCMAIGTKLSDRLDTIYPFFKTKNEARVTKVINTETSIYKDSVVQHVVIIKHHIQEHCF